MLVIHTVNSITEGIRLHGESRAIIIKESFVLRRRIFDDEF